MKWASLRRVTWCGWCGTELSRRALVAVGESVQRARPRRRLVVCQRCARERYGMRPPEFDEASVARDGKALAVGED